ncbi:vWA domain-containing protein [Longilinea arvoryzae]|nr:hypothetical protein [Longilinea arvoryzae]
METLSAEKKRADNIVWTASNDYSFKPDYEIYDSRGIAELYWNYIVGAVHNYYDYSQLQGFFRQLKQDRDYVFYEGLTWIGLENCAFEKGKNERPVLKDLRWRYAEKVLRKEDGTSFYYLVDEIKRAHFQRALGKEPRMREQVAYILDDLEFDGSLSTEQILLRMNEIIDTYFPLNPVLKKRNFLKNLIPNFLNLSLVGNESERMGNALLGDSLLRFPNSGISQPSEDEVSTELRNQKNGKEVQWKGIQARGVKKQRENIQSRYGASILTEAQTRTLEKSLCTGNHKNCHLHFTRGEFDSRSLKGNGNGHRKDVLDQREINTAHYRKNLARNKNNILKLTNILKNTMLVNLDTTCYRTKAGALVAGKIWRNIYLNDQKVFIKNIRDDLGDLSVDILLDSSGSQMNRQAMIATEGYIIAESLSGCQIPVRVYSFCTNGDYTVLNLFRDYNEVTKNDRIFDFHSSGCNRDGLAIRTALRLMDHYESDHKILIVLSDCKPIDPHGLPVNAFNPDQFLYADSAGVNDVAMEVRKGRLNGTSILCVFTGLDDDLPAAKKIYGQNMARIKSLEKFADVVGVLLQNELKNL